LKLTQLVQLGLVSLTTFALTGALSSCSSGDDSLAAGSVAGSGNLITGQPGGQTNATGGAGAVAQAGSATVSGAGVSSGGASSGGVGNPGVGNANGGTTAAVPCTNLPPNNGDSCAHAVEYGWCKQAWLGDSCRQDCGKCSSGTAGTGTGTGTIGGGGVSSGGTGSGGASNGSAGAYTGGYGGGGGQPPAIQGGTQGWASRYWDCCKPACGWKANVPGNSSPVHSCNKSDQSLGGNYDAKNACEGDQSGAYMCHDFGPWAVSNTLAYGYAAVKMGSDYCGKCYQIQFTGTSHSASNDPGAQSLSGKTMIVQAINTGGVDGTQFDLLIPGGGVGDFNACSAQWGTSDLGEQYGGFYLDCQKKNGFAYAASKACAAAKCQSVFKDKPGLLAGCNFFINWMGAPDNPNLVFKETTCPDAITQLSGLKR
jgi:Glycosyl hydrolase family 45